MDKALLLLKKLDVIRNKGPKPVCKKTRSMPETRERNKRRRASLR